MSLWQRVSLWLSGLATRVSLISIRHTDIQSSLPETARSERDVSQLGAVMAFLYASHIILNAVLSTVLGRIIDRDVVAALQQTGGVQFSVGCAIILAASLVPRGAWSVNPRVLGSTDRPEPEVVNPIELSLVPRTTSSSPAQSSCLDGEEHTSRSKGSETEIQNVR